MLADLAHREHADMMWQRLRSDELMHQQLAQITSREPPEVIKAGKLALRLSVDSGGCHGYQDTLSLTEDRNVDD
jgi:Fe-S cluster assembly iron-binding protein IscA